MLCGYTKMKQSEFKNRLKKKMTFKNFLTLLHIAKGCADEGLVIKDIDVGDFIYLDMFNNETDEFFDELDKELIL